MKTPLAYCCPSRRVVATLFVLFLAAACGSDGCDMDGFREAPYPLEPDARTMPVSAEVRITSHGLNFLSGQVDNIISEFQDGGLSFCIPPTEASGMQLCHQDSYCDDGSVGCQLTLTIDEASLTPVPQRTLRVDVTIGNLHNSLPINGLGLSCWLNLYSSAGNDVPAQIPASIPLEFKPEELSPFKDMRVEIGELTANIDDVRYNMTGRGSANWLCAGANWGIQTFLDGFLRSMIMDELEGMVDGMTDEMLCRTCHAGDDPCPSNSSCQLNDDDLPVCMYDSADRCVPTVLGIEGMLEPAALLGDFLAGVASDIHLTGRVADRAVADTGLTLGVRTGTEPVSFSSCAPVDLSTRPSFDPVEPSPSLNSNVNPGGAAFMFGMALHRRTLQHLFWSLWASGALCMEVGSEQVDMLTTGAIGALVPSINHVALRQGPMIVRLSPQRAPDVRLGANRVQGDDVEEGLIILDWKDLDIHMYGFVLERYARLFTVRADIELPIAVVPDGDDSLMPVLGDIEGAIDNLRILNDEILDADHERILELLPTLLGFALPQLADALADPIELPEMLGYRIVLDQNSLRGVDNNQYLGLFANLEFVGASGQLITDLRAAILNHRVEVEREEDRLPKVALVLETGAFESGLPLDAEGVEFFYRLNGGGWHMLGRGSEITLTNPVLRLQGEHRLEVKARRTLEGARIQRAATELEFIVDYEAPTLDVWQEQKKIMVRASDVVDSPEQMQLRHRLIVDDVPGAWSAFGPVAPVVLSANLPAGDVVVEVEVQDRAGHSTSEEVRVSRRAMEAGTVYTEETRGCGGCSAAGGSGTNGVTLLLLVLGLIAIRLRPRGRQLAMLAAVVALFVASGCGGCSEAGTLACAEDCEGAQACVEGQCVDVSCSEDSDCSADCGDDMLAVCDGGICVCEAYCAEGCPSDRFCCYSRNRCQRFPDWCEDVECDPGFEAQITHIGDHDNNTCEVSDGRCECVSLPPLPLWYHGAYSSIARGGGVTAVAVHNLHYRDLMVGILTKDYEVEEWFFVDGVPRRGNVEGAVDGPRRGITNVGDRVGTHTATAVDASGTVHVFYRDEDDRRLKYGRVERDGGEWTYDKVVVDEDGDAGFFSTVALLGDTLHVFYTARSSEGLSEVRHRAVPVDTALDAVADTPMQVVHSGQASIPAREGDLVAAGIYLQVVVEGDELFLSFFDNIAKRPAWLRGDGESFDAPTHLNVSGAVGPYSSARPDANGDVHVVYMEKWPPALAYQVVGGARETIASGVRHTANGTSQTPIGHDAQLQLLDDGRIEVFFHDASTHELMRAVRNGGWELQSLGGDAGRNSAAHGLFPRALTLDDGTRLVMDFVINTTGEVREGRPVFRVVD